MKNHKFGGSWTEEKLECLKSYLGAYTTIFTGNPRAKFYTTTYVDAFAGTGYRTKIDRE
jgi:three-Cys-motif partner protein